MQNVQNSYKHEFMLIFSIEVDGEVTVKQVFGALYRQTDVLDCISLSTLQSNGEAGKCLLEGGGNTWLLRIPVTMSLTKAALLAAAIECIDEVARRPARFRLLSLETRMDKMLKIAQRAKQLSNVLYPAAAGAIPRRFSIFGGLENGTLSLSDIPP